MKNYLLGTIFLFMLCGVTYSQGELVDTSFNLEGEYFSGKSIQSYGVLNNSLWNSSFCSLNVNDNMYSKIEAFVSRETNFKTAYYMVVLYGNVEASKLLDNIVVGNLNGISVYVTTDGNVLTHYYFGKKGNKFYPENKLSQSVLGVNLRQIERILLHQAQGTSYLLFSNIKSDEDINFSGQDELVLVEAQWRDDVPFIDPGNDVGTRGVPCADEVPGCDEDSKYPDCLRFGSHSFKCQVADGCFMTRASTTYYNNIRFEEVSSNSEENLYHKFRDDFLIKSSLGKKYINYYYLIGSYLTNNPNLELTVNTFKLLPLVNRGINRIFDDSTSNDILIEEDFANKLVSLFKEYKAHYKNLNLDIVLNDMIDDVDKMKNKSVNDVIKMFN